MNDELINNDLISAFFRNFENGPKLDEDYWAWEYIDKLVTNNPSKAWKIILELINSAPSADALGYVSASSFEDLIQLHGKTILPYIERSAETYERVRYALIHVCVTDKYDVFPAFCKLRDKYKNQNVDPFAGP